MRQLFSRRCGPTCFRRGRRRLQRHCFCRRISTARSTFMTFLPSSRVEQHTVLGRLAVTVLWVEFTFDGTADGSFHVRKTFLPYKYNEAGTILSTYFTANFETTDEGMSRWRSGAKTVCHYRSQDGGIAVGGCGSSADAFLNKCHERRWTPTANYLRSKA